MKTKQRKILLTGSTGFIGKVLVKLLLSEGFIVYAISRKKKISREKNLFYFNCDLRDIDKNFSERIIKKIKKVDAIIYLAASITEFFEKKESMLEAKENTLDPFIRFIENFGCLTEKIIFTSTIDVYGIPNVINFKESAEINLISTYAIAKYCCEKYLEFYCKLNNKLYSIIRFSQVYGPNEPLVRVTPFIINAAMNDKVFNLKGSGKDKRRLLYVEDAAAGVIKALNKGKNGIYHIAGDEIVSVEDIIKTVEKILKRKLKILQENKDNPTVDIVPDIEKAKKELNFNPEYSLEKGISSIINSFAK